MLKYNMANPGDNEPPVPPGTPPPGTGNGAGKTP